MKLLPYGTPDTSIPLAATSVQIKNFTSPLLKEKKNYIINHQKYAKSIKKESYLSCGIN